MAIDLPGRGTMQERRFACTQCGKCCNRSPEVELSEAAPLSDVFVFRLMFRLYWLPRHLADYRERGESTATAEAAFYQKKRLLAAFAAHKASARSRRMKADRSANASLPSFEEIEANAPFGATTTSMRIAWQIAADAGMMRVDEYRTLVAKQLATIERQLADGCSANNRQTLLEMQT